MPQKQIQLTEIVNLRNPEIAVVYVRGDTRNEIEHELRYGLTYTTTTLQYDIEGNPIDHLSDPDFSGQGRGRHKHGQAAAVFYDDNETYPAEVEHVLNITRKHEIRDIVMPHINTISDSWRDVHGFIDVVTEEGTTVHTIHDDLSFSSVDSVALETLEAVARTERNEAREYARRRIEPLSNGSRGRPPIGFTSKAGSRRPASDYDDLASALADVDAGDMSVYQASKITGYSRDAINTAITDRRELYRLDD